MRIPVARGLALAAVMALAAACSSSGSSAAPAGGGAATGSAIKIGGGFALTGDESALDLPAANGAKLAVKQINAAGGVNGSPDRLHRPRQPVQDGRDRPDGEAVRRAGQGPVDGRLHGHRLGARVGPDVPERQDPVHHGRRDVAEDPVPGRRHDVPRLLRRQRPGRRRVPSTRSTSSGTTPYFLWDKGVEYTTLLGQYFKARFTELGGTIALEDSYDDKATDFSAQITKLKALSPAPDFYYVAAMPNNIGPLVKQFRDAGLTGPDRRRRRLRHPGPRQDRGRRRRATCSSRPTR